MLSGARKLELCGDLRSNTVSQLLAERAKDLILSLGVSVQEYYELVRRGDRVLKPGGLQEPFGHFHGEGLAPWRDTYLNGNSFHLQMCHEMRK